QSQSCGQRCLHRHRAANQSFQSGMPTVPAPEIDATAPHSPRSPVSRPNQPLSARTLQPRLNVKRKQAFATIPIVPNLRGFVQSGFYEVALTTRPPGHVLPRDLTEPSRFKHAHLACKLLVRHSRLSAAFAGSFQRSRLAVTFTQLYSLPCARPGP